MKLMKNCRGLTLVEIMLIVAILTVVAMIFLLVTRHDVKETVTPGNWCPETMVTIETIVAKENHLDETRIPNNEAVKPAFMKLPYVVLADAAGPQVKYEGYILSSPFPNDMTSILDYQRNKIPLCVDFVRTSVFVLYEPLELK